MNSLAKNLKTNCGVDSIYVTSSLSTYKHGNEVKLYMTKEDACNETGNYEWKNITLIVGLNNSATRPTGIVCHTCENDTVILSIIVQDQRDDASDRRQNTMFCLANKIEIR